MVSMEEKIVNLEREVLVLQGTVAQLVGSLNVEKIQFMDAVQTEFAKHKLGLAEVVTAAQVKFLEVEERLRASEKEKSTTGGKKGFLPDKMMVPEKFSDDITHWRKWKEMVAKYFDEGREGLKAIMDEVGRSTTPVDVEILEQAARRHPHAIPDLVKWKHLYRALEKLVDGEAAKVIESVQDENGFEAWRQLHVRFEPELEAQKNVVLLELHNIPQAVSIEETKGKLVELRVRITKAENILGVAIQDVQKRTAMLQILDPITKQHMAGASGRSFSEFYTAVMNFANNASSGEAASSSHAKTAAKKKEEELKELREQEKGKESFEWGAEGAAYGELNAFGKGKGKGKGKGPCWTCEGPHLQRDCPTAGQDNRLCYGCGGSGHLAAQCPAKGKGKGKSKGFGTYGSSYGPAAGKGWHHGGKGKGKSSGKGLYSIGEDYYGSQGYYAEHQFPAESFCSSLKTVEPKIVEAKTNLCGGGRGCCWLSNNKFACLEPAGDNDEDEDESSAEEASEAPKPSADWKTVTKKKRAKLQKVTKWKKLVIPSLSRSGSRLTIEKYNSYIKEPEDQEERPRRQIEKVKPIRTIEPAGGLNAVVGEWEEIKFSVDSGATETVTPSSSPSCIPVTEGEAFKRGVGYEVANGVTIPNLGEKRFMAMTEQGTQKAMVAQVCEVNQGLLSVSKAVAAGNRVIFAPDQHGGSFIENMASGEKTWLRAEGGMYTLKMWVKRAAGDGF
jgi:hypothetical protein